MFNCPDCGKEMSHFYHGNGYKCECGWEKRQVIVKVRRPKGFYASFAAEQTLAADPNDAGKN